MASRLCGGREGEVTTAFKDGCKVLMLLVVLASVPIAAAYGWHHLSSWAVALLPEAYARVLYVVGWVIAGLPLCVQGQSRKRAY